MQESINVGFRLGIVLFGLFSLSAVGVYVLVGVAGSEGKNQLIVALCLGPLLGSLIFGGWWLAKRAPGNQEP